MKENCKGGTLSIGKLIEERLPPFVKSILRNYGLELTINGSIPQLSSNRTFSQVLIKFSSFSTKCDTVKLNGTVILKTKAIVVYYLYVAYSYCFEIRLFTKPVFLYEDTFLPCLPAGVLLF